MGILSPDGPGWNDNPAGGTDVAGDVDGGAGSGAGGSLLHAVNMIAVTRIDQVLFNINVHLLHCLLCEICG